VIPKRNGKFISYLNIDLVKLKKLIDEGLSSRQCSKEIGCSQTNIRYWAKKNNWNFMRRVKKGRKVVGRQGICRFCGKDFSENKRRLGGHAVHCKFNPHEIVYSHDSCPHTKETKLKISIKRREYLERSKKNHNWSFCHGKQSDPEKKFQVILEELKIQFIPEHTPEESKRFYRIDFALLDKKIGFEINGNQHYTDAKRGKLKKYYRERQTYLESLGWMIINIHYSLVYDKDKVLFILDKSL
jgi:very-short-patch-repair endonuclease